MDENMVNFATRQQEEREGPWPVDIKPDEGKIVLPCDNEAAMDSLLNFIHEGNLDDSYPRWFRFSYRKRASVDHPSVVLNTSNNFGEDEKITDVGIISSREHPDGCEVEVQIYPQSFDSIDTSVTTMFDAPNPHDTGNSILNFILDNRERVTLGYGTEHIFDDIQPIHTPKDQTERSCVNILKDYLPWIQEIIRRTQSSNNEYAFYVDRVGNTIGVIEGSRNSVDMPPLDDSNEQLSFHTHPRLKSSLVPSENDIGHANKALRMGGRMFIIYGGASLYFKENLNDDYSDGIEYPHAFDVGIQALCVEKVELSGTGGVERVIKNNQKKLRASKENLFTSLKEEADRKLEGINDDIEAIIRDQMDDGERNMEKGIESGQPHFERMREIATDDEVTFIYKPVTIQP